MYKLSGEVFQGMCMVLAGDKWEVVYKTVLHASLHLCNAGFPTKHAK